MARYVSWVVNLGLLALSCWFVAQGALRLIEAWFSPPPSGEALARSAANVVDDLAGRLRPALGLA